MKQEFYNSSKRANIYNSIFYYKIISLVIVCIATIALIVQTIRDKNSFKSATLIGGVPLFLIIILVFIALFILSIIADFYILKRTTALGNRLNQMAYLDRLTGIPNRFSCDLLFESFNDSEKLPNAGFIVMRINNLVEINKQSGHDGGNSLIAEFCSILEDVGENYGYIGRNGGNEFIILMENCDNNSSDMFLADLTKRIHGYNELRVGEPLEIAYARVINSDLKAEKISDIISLSYKKLRETPLTLS